MCADDAHTGCPSAVCFAIFHMELAGLMPHHALVTIVLDLAFISLQEQHAANQQARRCTAPLVPACQLALQSSKNLHHPRSITHLPARNPCTRTCLQPQQQTWCKAVQLWGRPSIAWNTKALAGPHVWRVPSVLVVCNSQCTQQIDVPLSICSTSKSALQIIGRSSNS